MNPIPRLKPYQGPVLLSYGFRPFFFLGACQSAIAIAVWLPLYQGELTVPTLFAPRDWHAHEMIYGYVPAVITGFLLTAIPNWTGRLPLQGTPLLVLVLVWLAGRGAVTWGAYLGWITTALIDCAFLVLVASAAAREIIAGRNWRNLRVLIPVTVLALGNVWFHLEAHFHGVAEYALRTGVSAILVLIMLIGGRIIPSFTRNWLARENPGRLPLPFGKLDLIAIALGAGALGLWIVWPAGVAAGLVLCLAALLHTARLASWAGERTSRERLVLILHVAYAFVPLGFLLAALAAFDLIPGSAGLHAWMAGAAGTMTLAVMTRASLGHTGQQLAAGAGTEAIYAAVVFAALVRVAAALYPSAALPLLHAAALGWVIAFGGFALLYGPLLFRQRRS
ncbi:MAG TPA: NnrS family protein [Xanthobacteraceae bacterium]|jgi:uncharacterized protein involved in response to NO